MSFQKTVCVQHTQTYKLTHTHTHSLKRNEDKGLWRPWLAVIVVKVELPCFLAHARSHMLGTLLMDGASDRWTVRNKEKEDSDRQGKMQFLCLPAKLTIALKIPFQQRSLPTTFKIWTRTPLSATVAGSVDRPACPRSKGTQHVAGSCCWFQPGGHVEGEEEQRGAARSISTHTQPGSLQRTCTADSSLHA